MIAPNFAIGAVLMMRFAEMAAPYFETAEIIELHHDAKLDVAVGHGDAHGRAHGRGVVGLGRGPHAYRGRGGCARRQGPGRHPRPLGAAPWHRGPSGGLLGTTGQTLTIRHDSYDRDSFMPGVLLAVKAVADRPGLTIGLDALLEL